MTASADSSRRYVLPENAPLVANLAALWTCEPGLAAAIEELGDVTIEIEPSKSGPATACRMTTGGKRIYLHSRYQPLDEAARLIDTVGAAEHVAFYVLGFGMGYHVQNLFDRASSEAIICVFEPDLEILRAGLSHRDYSKLILSGRVWFFWTLDKPGLFSRLTPQAAMMSMGFQGVVHGPSLQLNPQFYGQVQTWLSEFADFSRTNITTLVLNSKRTSENIARNVGWYVAAASLDRLGGRYRKCPAVIVSAGPSLRKNVGQLKDLAGRAVVIAVQTTLQPLLEMGIEPHFVTSLDYHEICSRFFEKLPGRLKTELVAEAKATRAIFHMHTGPVTMLGNEYAEGLLREMNLNKPMLTPGATVAHLAYYLAEHLACDPIIFIGQDLGFSDGLCYTPGTSYEDVWRPELGRFCTVEMKQWDQIVRDRYILRKVPDYLGRTMYTEERLFTYLQQFERDFGSSRATIIDATEGGVLKQGTRPMKLADAAAMYCTRKLETVPNDHPGVKRDRLGEAKDCLLTRQIESRRIEEIARQTLPLLSEMRDGLDDQARVNRLIAKVDQLRVKMDAYGQTYDLVTQLTQQTELDRFHSDRKLAASRLSGLDRQRHQLDRDIANVEAVIEAAGEFSRLMDESIAAVDLFARDGEREAA